MNKDDGYRLLAGKCKLYCEAIVAADPAANWTLVRGHYFDPIWCRNREHWWLKSPDGVIYDPTREQFPTCGHLEDSYMEFTGVLECSQCYKKVKEEKAIIHGNYGFCSEACAMHFVGL